MFWRSSLFLAVVAVQTANIYFYVNDRKLNDLVDTRDNTARRDGCFIGCIARLFAFCITFTILMTMALTDAFKASLSIPEYFICFISFLACLDVFSYLLNR